jgi:hypothetical protein
LRLLYTSACWTWAAVPPAYGFGSVVERGGFIAVLLVVEVEGKPVMFVVLGACARGALGGEGGVRARGTQEDGAARHQK